MKRMVLACLATLAAAPAGAALAQAPAAPAAPGGEAAYIVDLLDKACLPLISGAKADDVAKQAGLKKTTHGLVMKIDPVQQIVVSPPTVANPNVCAMDVDFAPGQSQPIVDALAGWGAGRNPPLQVLNPGTPTPQGAVTTTTWSWTGDTAQAHEGLTFNAQKTADGRPVEKNHDTGSVMFIKQANP